MLDDDFGKIARFTLGWMQEESNWEMGSYDKMGAFDDYRILVIKRNGFLIFKQTKHPIELFYKFKEYVGMSTTKEIILPELIIEFEFPQIYIDPNIDINELRLEAVEFGNNTPNLDTIMKDSESRKTFIEYYIKCKIYEPILTNALEQFCRTYEP